MYYIHHMAQSIRASAVLASIAAETREAIQRQYPGAALNEPRQPIVTPGRAADHVLRWPRTAGVVTRIDVEVLFNFARERALIIAVAPMVGEFVPQDAPIASVWGAFDDDANGTLIGAFGVGNERSMEQDVAFGFRQLIDIARLVGARLVVSIEVEDGQQLATALIKGLTGGDRVSARFLYKEAFEFTPRFTIWIAANHRPGIPDDDAAMWERVREVPFTVTIPPGERDPQVKRVLADPGVSGMAILAWAVQGCLDWQKNGLRASDAVATATADYRTAMDPMTSFLEECCVVRPDAWTASSDLRTEYEKFCRERGEEPLSGNAVSGRLKARGFTASLRGHGNARGWCGIGLLTGEAQDAIGAIAAIGTFGNSPSGIEIQPKLPDQVIAADRTADFESVAYDRGDRGDRASDASAPVGVSDRSSPRSPGRSRTDATTTPICDDGCGAPVENAGELCEACSPLAHGQSETNE